MPPSLLTALGMGVRALVAEPWLVAAGAVVAGARRAATWPALAVALTLMTRAALGALAARPLDPAAPLRAALAALTAPQGIALVAGLWLAGAALAGALRVAWLAGALPTLGGAMAGLPGEPRFARGVAYGFPTVLATAALALVAEIAAASFSAVLVVAAVRVTVHVVAGDGGVALAAAVALVGALAVAVPVAVGALADAAVARAALRLEPPGRAFARATRRFVVSPGAFLLAALVYGVTAAVVPAVIRASSGAAVELGEGVPPLLSLGPALMGAAAAIVVVAALDLLWLGTIAALAVDAGPSADGSMRSPADAPGVGSRTSVLDPPSAEGAHGARTAHARSWPSLR